MWCFLNLKGVNASFVGREGAVASPRYSAPGMQCTVTPHVLCLCFTHIGWGKPNACQCRGRRVGYTALYGNIQLPPPSVPLSEWGGNFCAMDECGFRTLQCERIAAQTKCKPMAVYTNGSVPMTLYTVCIHSHFQRHPTRASTSPTFEQRQKNWEHQLLNTMFHQLQWKLSGILVAVPQIFDKLTSFFTHQLWCFWFTIHVYEFWSTSMLFPGYLLFPGNRAVWVQSNKDTRA